MADEKESKQLDVIDDGYQYMKHKNKLLASSDKSIKQSGNDYKLSLIPVKRVDNIDIIQKCIGQLSISYDNEKDVNGNDIYRYGTGTMYKQLDKKYYLVITCAHNLTYFNDKTHSKEKVKKLFYLPTGIQDQKTRLKCIEWVAHPQYNPNTSHCPHDIGIILCYDGLKYYKKQNINVNDVICIKKCNKNILKNCNI
eukprot:56924_1